MREKISIILLVVFFSNNIVAQSKVNVKDIFKMNLFLNNKTIIFRNMDYSLSKDDSLYTEFKKGLDIKIDTLKITNRLKGIIENDYIFCKVSQSNILYNKNLSKEEMKYIRVNGSLNDYYIIAINQTTSISYRLAGFEINDFLAFLLDFKDYFYKSNFFKLKTSMFVKNYIVENLDFECLQTALSKTEINREKYSCLFRCSDPIRMY